MYIACYSGQTCDPPHVARVTSSSIGRRFSKQTLNMAHRLQFTNRKHSIDKTKIGYEGTDQNCSRHFVIACPEHTVAQLVEALRYKPGSRGFDSR